MVGSCRPGHFTPDASAPKQHWVEDWDGQKADLEIVVKESLPLPGMEPQLSCM